MERQQRNNITELNEDRCSDSLYELALACGWRPSDEFINEWPSFDSLTLSSVESMNLARSLEAALAKNVPKAEQFIALIGLLRSGGVMLRAIYDDRGILSEDVLISPARVWATASPHRYL